MRWPSMLAIYALFWAMSLFLVLPFRLQTKRGEDRTIPGQAESAPPRFSLPRTALWTTLVSSAFFLLFLANYEFGWVGPDAFNLVPDSIYANDESGTVTSDR
jgi:predicted secreted protein